MNYKILENINNLIKSDEFEILDEQSKYELILNNIKEIIIKFSLSLNITINDKESLSYLLIELNDNLDYKIKQTLNLEITHALINTMMAINKNQIEWNITDDKQLKIHPLYSYDLNMTLLSIKTYSEMDLGNLTIYLIKTIESNLNNKKYTLKTAK